MNISPYDRMQGTQQPAPTICPASLGNTLAAGHDNESRLNDLLLRVASLADNLTGPEFKADNAGQNGVAPPESLSVALRNSAANVRTLLDRLTTQIDRIHLVVVA